MKIVTDLSNSFNPYPKIQQKKENKKHKQTKATEIPQKVKERVWKRDKHRCICCKKEVEMTCANAHFIKRSQRRLGHRGKHSYIVSKMPLRRRFWTRNKKIRKLHRKLFKRHLWSKVEQRKIDL